MEKRSNVRSAAAPRRSLSPAETEPAMPVRRTLTAAAAALLAACAPVPPPAEGGAPVPGPAGAETLVSSLSVRPAGDTVHLALQVTNATAAPVVLRFNTGQTYDFSVHRGGELLWQWSETMRFMQALRDETLAPGETRTITEHWVPPSRAAGELTARGWLTSASHPLERTATFRMP
jgi:hypothetical protein